MMRDLGFEVNFSASSTDDITFRIGVGSNYTAKELLADQIIGTLPREFATLLASTKNTQQKLDIVERSRDVIEMSISSAIISEPWQIAAILNLLDNETFIGKLDGDPFITDVVVLGPRPMNLEHVYETLNDHVAHSRNIMTGFLPDGFEVDQYVGHRWPEVASDYMFKVIMTFGQGIPPAIQQEIGVHFDRMDAALAGSAFEVDTAPEEWFEDGVVPYPVSVDMEGDTISYTVEMPPSDFASCLLLVLQILKVQYGLVVRDWTFEIVEGW